MKNLDFDPVLSGDSLTIMIPGYREDMESYQDVAEEVIREYGYDHVVPTFMPTAQVTIGGRDLRQRTELRIKRALCAQGAYEGMHYSFFSKADLDLLRLPEDAKERQAIPILNPLNEDISLMRTILAPQMIRASARNQKRGTLSGRIYELAKVFIPKALPLQDYPEEIPTLSIGVFGENESFFTLKGLVETVAKTLGVKFTYEKAQRTFLHPYQTAEIFCGGVCIGFMGKVRYEIEEELDCRTDTYIAELNMQILLQYYGNPQVYTALPKFDIEKRDFAFVVDSEVTCAQLENAIAAACDYITSVQLFDVYEGAQVGLKKKSMAFSVVFTPREKAFTDAEITGYVNDILRALKEGFGAELRS